MDSAFLKSVQTALDSIDAETLSYDESEFWIIKRPYEYIEEYAIEHELFNTAVALPLSRGLHNGTHRKSGFVRNGKQYRLPYVIHCLLVCRMLIDIRTGLSRDEEDIVLASALCHDMIEDLHFEDGGREIYTVYGLDPRVYETVKKVSKRKDFTDEEHQAYFDRIQEDRLALLVKLSDRGNNVEDLYNMTIWKTHEYIGETRKYFFPMCEYALSHYEELYRVFDLLQDKIRVLTGVAEILVDRYTEMDSRLSAELETLRAENAQLGERLKELQKEAAC